MDKIRRHKNSPVTLKITGMILSEGYQKSKIYATKLRKHQKKYFREPVIKGFLEVDWIQYLNRLQRSMGGQTWAVRKGVVVFIDDSFIGQDQELFDYYKLTYPCNMPSSETIKTLARQEYLEYLKRTNLLYTYMEFSLDQEYMGTLLFELQRNMLPRTCSWFASLCDSQRGVSYKGSSVFRICKGGWFQAGRMDFPYALEDESFSYAHDRRGIISFANYGKDSNKTEFLVTFSPCGWMDQRYVAFGRVVEGWDLLRRIENISCTYESPNREITISNCGVAQFHLEKKTKPSLELERITARAYHIHLIMSLRNLIMRCLEEGLKEKLNLDLVKSILNSTMNNFDAALNDKLDKDLDHTFLSQSWILGIESLVDLVKSILNSIMDSFNAALNFKADEDIDHISLPQSRISGRESHVDLVKSILNFIMDSFESALNKKLDEDLDKTVLPSSWISGKESHLDLVKSVLDLIMEKFEASLNDRIDKESFQTLPTP